MRNFWLLKAKEKILLKIVAWAQKQGIKVENLTTEQIREAIKKGA